MNVNWIKANATARIMQIWHNAYSNILCVWGGEDTQFSSIPKHTEAFQMKYAYSEE